MDFEKLTKEIVLPLVSGYLGGFLGLQMLGWLVMPLGIAEGSVGLSGWVLIYIEFLMSTVTIVPLCWYLVSRIFSHSFVACAFTAIGMWYFNYQISGVSFARILLEELKPGDILSFAQWSTILVLLLLSYIGFGNNSHNKSSQQDAQKTRASA